MITDAFCLVFLASPPTIIMQSYSLGGGGGLQNTTHLVLVSYNKYGDYGTHNSLPQGIDDHSLPAMVSHASKQQE